jgi:hypothetical protein
VLKQVFFLLILFSFPVLLPAQIHDSSFTKDSQAIKQDSAVKKDSIIPSSKIKIKHIVNYDSVLNKFLAENRFLNSSGSPIASKNKFRKKNSQDFIFYLLLSIVFLLAFLQLFYKRYFNNLFRVFFNTSLRQSQLTDQLLQAKLPSLLFNIFFIITGGIYIYFLLRYFHWITSVKMISILFSCIICLAVIYIAKFLALKFTGWLSGYTEVTNTYLFIIFLINKIVGILLVPIIIIIVFSEFILVKSTILISLSLIMLLLIMRFYRSYGLLQNRLKISRVHFFLYIIGTEVIPLLLIYKSLMILLSKNL